jgi:F-type H+-transporting ATPase subunit b
MGDPFSPTLGVFFWQLIVLIVLFTLLWKFGFPAILAATEAREARIKKDLADAEEARTGTAALLEEQRSLLASARGEAKAIVTEAREAAERERAIAVEKTRTEQDELLERARREIGAERERAVADIRREAVDIAISAAAKVVGSRLDAAADRKIVEDYITSIGSGAK